MGLISAILLFALTRAEIIERFKSPVVTQSDGLVKVYADCPEDMRREFQSPVARFAADTVQILYQGIAKRPVRFSRPGIVITLGDVRTNLTDVVVRVSTNDQRVVTRIWLRSPGYADLDLLRMALIKGFYRSVEKRELSDIEAIKAYRKAKPELRVYDERMKLESWLAGKGTTNDEEGLRLMYRIFEPGKASKRDVLIFASRLFLYPAQYDAKLAGKYSCLSFSEAVKYAKTDPSTRIAAYVKANEMPILGGGRGEDLAGAADAYRLFLLEFAASKKTEDELMSLLDEADVRLNVAFDRAKEIK